MEKAQAIVLITCVISVLSGVMDALKPDHRFDKQLRLLLSVVFVLAVLTPFAGGARQFRLHWNSGETFSSDALANAAAEETKTAAARNLEAALTEILAKGGVPGASLQVVMHTTEDGSIDIEQVTAFCSDTETASRLLTQCLGEEVKIHVETAS